MSDKQKNLIVRTISGVFFIAIMVTGLLMPVNMMALFTLITTAAVWEYTGLVNNYVEKVQINRFISTAAAGFLFLAMAAYTSNMCTAEVFIPYLLTIVYLFISELYTKNEDSLADWAYTMMAQMYIALPFSTINILAYQDNGGVTEFHAVLPLCVFIFLWANDTGAYCSGSLFGRHKLFPRISPGKSWEGSIGGGILVLIIAALVGYFTFCPETQGAGDYNSALANDLYDKYGCGWAAFSYHFAQIGSLSPLTSNIISWMGLGLVVVFFGTWGDLVESLIKRTIGIKDSGNVLPGHGGMLDRFDSSLMAIPASVVYLYVLQYFS